MIVWLSYKVLGGDNMNTQKSSKIYNQVGYDVASNKGWYGLEQG